MIKREANNRIELLDAIRGFCIILMLAYHFAYDLVSFRLAPVWLLDNALLNVLQPIIAGVFIAIAGISSRFSRSNIRRGFIALGGAVLVSLFSYFAGAFVRFGILHFLGCAMIIYGLLAPALNKLPEKLAPALYAVLFIISCIITRDRISFKYLAWLGFRGPGFSSADYFPILPWIFVFLFGTFLGKLLKEERFPAWFYTLKIPILPVIGRWSFVIYLLHQPILYGLAALIAKLF